MHAANGVALALFATAISNFCVAGKSFKLIPVTLA
jgi:hypothetical protein